MPTTPVFIDPFNLQLKNILQNLPPTPGYGIFIDIAGSTKMKQQGITKWVAYIHNAFSQAHAFLSPFHPLKSIGDALMYYIEDTNLKGYNALQIYDGLWQMANETDPAYPVIKVGVVKCLDAYAITFFQNNQDYYGIDIDLTARLLQLAEDKEVVTDQRFYDDVMKHYRSTGNQEAFGSVKDLKGPIAKKLKGISQPINVYRTKLAKKSILCKLATWIKQRGTRDKGHSLWRGPNRG